MAKRLSSGQSNTLLNYFQSPKLKKQNTPQAEDSRDKKLNTTSGKSDDSPLSTKKRKKIAIIDSDSSEEENVPLTPIAKKKKNGNSSVSKSDYKSSDNETSLKERFQKPSTSTSNGDSEVNSEYTQIPKSVIPEINKVWLHFTLDFLQPDKILDMNKRKPSDPDYDCHTLLIPRDFLDKQTPAMRQWWILKSKHLDSVLFFKVGKFYELYHMDAVTGVNELGFSYMKGEFAHSGFPESAYHKMANALIEKGYKVARVEQTETPEMMAERNKNRKGGKHDKVVTREICQITTKGTCVYGVQLPEAMHNLSSHLYAIAEKDASANDRRFGICFVDTSTGRFYLAEFDDDKDCSKLLVCLCEYSPGLILTERQAVSDKLKFILNTSYGDIKKETLAHGSQFYTASKTLELLMNGNYFRDEDRELHLPKFFKEVADSYTPKPECELAIRALGACLWYLTDSKLDLQVVSMSKFQFYDTCSLDSVDVQSRRSMVLDATTIMNLNLFGPNSLQKVIDNCLTAFGKRLLHQWICRPLCNVQEITVRQEAVKELCENTVLLKEAQDLLRKLPDLERELAKIHVYGNAACAKDHPDSRAIFYEATTYSKRRINDLLNTLQAFEIAQNICPIFKDCNSSLLQKVTQFSPAGAYVDLTEHLLFFRNAFDQEEAHRTGKIIPKAGVDERFDQNEANIQEVKARLDTYLAELQKFFDCKVAYFGSDKKRFQIEIPESHSHKVTSEFQLEGTRKGAKPVKRYSTEKSRQLLADMMRAETEKVKTVKDLNRRIFEKFGQRRKEWDKAISCIGILDALCSLAHYARTYPHDMCIPEVEPVGTYNKIVIENGRYPCAANIDSFVPNDSKMGVEGYPNLLLLTGPNMGGKSTLMRQIAVICVMAHMGSHVPASSCKLSVIDRIFTRLGANDDILHGQSTFQVELSEAATILRCATANSLVLLDELGRGTSTHDGNAIATAYVEKLVTIQCRALFSTHYHSLVDQFEGAKNVQLGHMACMVENDADPTEESVTFLYKMASGRCPKSFGFNVAKLASLKDSLILRARDVSRELEEQCQNRNRFEAIFKSANVEALMRVLALK